jgi:hypothetical protein
VQHADSEAAESFKDGGKLFDLLEVTEADLHKPAFTLQDMMDLTVLHTRQMQELQESMEYGPLFWFLFVLENQLFLCRLDMRELRELADRLKSEIKEAVVQLVMETQTDPIPGMLCGSVCKLAPQ